MIYSIVSRKNEVQSSVNELMTECQEEGGKQMQTFTEPEKLVYKPAEVSTVLQTSLPVVYGLCKRADFPAIRIGRAIVIPKAALERWLEEQAASGRSLP